MATKLELEAATWKRRQINPSLSVEEARQPEHGSVISKWLADSNRFKLRYPGETNPHAFTRQHFDAAQKFHELHSRWLSAIDAKQQRSSSDFSGTGGHDGRDPFCVELARRHARAEAEFKEARRAVLESGPLGMMAIETIVIENQPADSLRGDLRTALNRLCILWRLTAEAT